MHRFAQDLFHSLTVELEKGLVYSQIAAVDALIEDGLGMVSRICWRNRIFSLMDSSASLCAVMSMEKTAAWKLYLLDR